MVAKKTVQEETDENVKRTPEMYFRTALLLFSWITMGVSNEITGPTIGMLAHNTNVTFYGIATALSAWSVGNLVTNIVFGFLQNLLNNHRDLMLTIAFFLRAILSSSTPFISSLILLSIVFFSQGISGSIANMAGTNLLLKMWKKRSAAPLNLVHFGYGFGAIIANLIVRPFLNRSNSYSTTFNSSEINSTFPKSNPMLVIWDIRYPYLIAGSISLTVGLGHLIFFIRGRINKVKYTPVNTAVSSSNTDNHPEKKNAPQYSPTTCGRGYFGYGLSLSLFFVIYIFFLVGMDQCFAKFYFSYLKFDIFGISTNAASWGIILFWFSFSMGRLIGAVQTAFIRVSICLVIFWCQNLIVGIMWMVYVWIIGLTPMSLFILGSFTGFSIGPLFASSFAWINEKLNVTPMVIAAGFCGAGLGSSILQKIAGYLMDYNPKHFPTLITVSVISSIIFFVILNGIAFIHQRNCRTRNDSVADKQRVTMDQFSEEEQKLENDIENGNE